MMSTICVQLNKISKWILLLATVHIYFVGLGAQEENQNTSNYISSPETIRLQREFAGLIERFAEGQDQENVELTIQLGRKTDKLEGHRFVTMRKVTTTLNAGTVKSITFASEQVNEANLQYAKRTLINNNLDSTDLSQIRIITEITFKDKQDYTLGSLENRKQRAQFSGFYRAQLREAVNYMRRYFSRKSEEQKMMLGRSILIGKTQK